VQKEIGTTIKKGTFYPIVGIQIQITQDRGNPDIPEVQ
jgi:hypothetical protein